MNVNLAGGVVADSSGSPRRQAKLAAQARLLPIICASSNEANDPPSTYRDAMITLPLRQEGYFLNASDVMR